jgi:hypothetical protein
MKPAEQREALLDLLGLADSFSADDAERQSLYEKRTRTGQEAHAFGDLPRLGEDDPLVERSSADLMERLRAAQEASDRVTVWEVARSRLENRAELERRNVEITEEALVKARHARDAAVKELAAHEAHAAPAPTEFTEDIQAELELLDEYNRGVRANLKLASELTEQKALRARYTELTHEIEAIDAKKAAAVAAAKMPVAGLGFDADGTVTFNGVPLSQASSAEQIKVSLAMAMALNPTIRVVRIMDGSLLDTDSMRLIAEMAAAADMQVWVERVQDGSPSAVVIEDGAVVS